jgi:hypothetical protein
MDEVRIERLPGFAVVQACVTGFVAAFASQVGTITGP